MGVLIKKEYLPAGDRCRVTFRLVKFSAIDAGSVCIVGDFNNWQLGANPMTRLKNGYYTITLELDAGKEYQYRFVIDDNLWENDWAADKYVKNPFDTENSVIDV